MIGSEGAYLVMATAGGYQTLHMTGAPKDIGFGIGWRAATSAETHSFFVGVRFLRFTNWLR